MLNGEIVVITKDEISDYLYQFGMIVKEKEGYLKIVDMFPPLPKEIQFSKIFMVNDSCPHEKENWNEGINQVVTDKGKYSLELLDESRENHISCSRNISYFSFKNFQSQLPGIASFNPLLIIDFRYNYGGPISLISQYYDYFINFLKMNGENKVICITGHSTASSAEILLEQLSTHSRIFMIGSETYGKEFAYKLIKMEDKLAMIPSRRLDISVNINKEFSVNDYYDFYFTNAKKYFVVPQILSFNFST